MVDTAVIDGRGDEALLRAIVDATQEAFVLADDRGRITDWNPAAQRLFGYSRGEVLGLTLGETIVPPAMRAAHEAGMARFMQTGEARVIGQRLELSATHKHGHEVPVELTITAVQAAGGRWRFAALLHDIAERRATEAGLRRLAAIVAAADGGIVALTGDGRIASWNPGARQITGRSDADAVGRPLADLFAAGGEGQAHGLLQRALAGETVRIDTTFAHADGNPVPVSLNLSALPDDGETGATALFRDITDRKVADERLAAFARRQRELAKRDDLTGLYNLRVLHEGLQTALQRGSVAVVRFDLRGLRAFNARLGALEGDRVLREFGRLLTAEEGTWAARIAGGEFALVLPGGERLDARRAGNRVAAALGGLEASVTACFGVAASSGGSRTAEALLSAAERDLSTRSNHLSPHA